jgi:hypothetical protein
MVGTPIQTQPVEHTIIPIYMATIDFNKWTIIFLTRPYKWTGRSLCQVIIV